jgi:hypothetical protein
VPVSGDRAAFDLVPHDAGWDLMLVELAASNTGRVRGLGQVSSWVVPVAPSQVPACGEMLLGVVPSCFPLQ